MRSAYWLEVVSGRSFRNYRDFSLRPHSGMNVVVGSNAQGKSNLIEALFCLLRGFSCRASHQGEVVMWGRTQAELKGVLHTGDTEVEVGFSYGPKGRQNTFSGEEVSRADLAAAVGIVLFTPDDLWLIKGGPHLRRRFMDVELGLLRPGYLDDLQFYRRALAQRNASLRRGVSLEEGNLWTAQLAHYGAKVVLARLEVLRRLAAVAAPLYEDWSGAGSGEELGLRYLSAVELSSLEAQDIEDALQRALDASLPRDLKMGQTSFGPHRDDLGLLLSGRQARLFASQGQQRSIILALKMAQVALWREHLGAEPIVLLDDVLYELDVGRRRRLLTHLQSRGQAFITVNDASSITGYGDRVFHVVKGGVLEKGEE